MVAYLKASLQEKTYSDYLLAAREVEKEDSMELSQRPQGQTTDNTAKSKATSFFPYKSLEGPSQQLTHLPCAWQPGRGDCQEGQKVESEDPNGIDGVMEEFMVHLARAVKDTQIEERHCYHCDSLEHCICDCPLVKASGVKSHLNSKEGMAPKKGDWAPLMKVIMPKTATEVVPKV